jgi:hypothetical protein
VVRLQDLGKLGTDAQGRVEGRRSILRHIADQPAADAAQLGRRRGEYVDALYRDAPAGDLGAAPLVGQQRGGGGRLA